MVNFGMSIAETPKKGAKGPVKNKKQSLPVKLKVIEELQVEYEPQDYILNRASNPLTVIESPSEQSDASSITLDLESPDEVEIVLLDEK